MRNMGLAFGSALAGLIANMAGLKEDAEVVVLSHAIDLIHIADIILAILTVLSLITFMIYCDREKEDH